MVPYNGYCGSYHSAVHVPSRNIPNPYLRNIKGEKDPGLSKINRGFSS